MFLNQNRLLVLYAAVRRSGETPNAILSWEMRFNAGTVAIAVGDSQILKM
jgi:hypothetical protein